MAEQYGHSKSEVNKMTETHDGDNNAEYRGETSWKEGGAKFTATRHISGAGDSNKMEDTATVTLITIDQSGEISNFSSQSWASQELRDVNPGGVVTAENRCSFSFVKLSKISRPL